MAPPRERHNKPNTIRLALGTCAAHVDAHIKMNRTFSAVVLAGGRSTRMGTEKALLVTNGRAWWDRQCDVLREAGASEVFLSARPDQRWTKDSAVISRFDAVVQDVIPECGPLGGITAALAHATYPHVAVLAIDLPAMPATWFRALLAKAQSGVGVVGRREHFFEPLAAVYPRELRELASRALAEGDYSLQNLLSEAVAQGLMRVTEIGPEEAAWFKNWNEPAGG